MFGPISARRVAGAMIAARLPVVLDQRRRSKRYALRRGSGSASLPTVAGSRSAAALGCVHAITFFTMQELRRIRRNGRARARRGTDLYALGQIVGPPWSRAAQRSGGDAHAASSNRSPSPRRAVSVRRCSPFRARLAPAPVAGKRLESARRKDRDPRHALIPATSIGTRDEIARRGERPLRSVCPSAASSTSGGTAARQPDRTRSRC